MTPDISVLGTAAAPLGFTTKAEAVYREIRARILSGALDPGAPLNQDALAPELGVSVTPVREAVRRLEAEGLVQFQAHKTVVVTPLSRAELGEIYDIRLQLDPHAAALAAMRATADEVGEVQRLARAPVSDDALEQVALNRAFHRAIYAGSGNALMTQILDRLWELTDRYRVMLVRGDSQLRVALREHVEIAEAMSAREPSSVAELIRAHIASARRLIEDALE